MSRGGCSTESRLPDNVAILKREHYVRMERNDSGSKVVRWSRSRNIDTIVIGINHSQNGAFPFHGHFGRRHILERLGKELNFEGTWIYVSAKDFCFKSPVVLDLGDSHVTEAQSVPMFFYLVLPITQGDCQFGPIDHSTNWLSANRPCVQRQVSTIYNDRFGSIVACLSFRPEADIRLRKV